MNVRKGIIGLSVILVLVLAACGSAATSNPPPTAAPGAQKAPPQVEQTARIVQVETTKSLKFNPSEISAAPGEQVEFAITNTSSFGHTFTVATSRAKEKILKDVTIRGNEKKSFTITFPEQAGTLYLFCRPHEGAGMVGAIRVEAK